jgi:LacI family transcriptional regulator
MSVTLEDIARATGFSVPTVSRVISNSAYPVSAATRQRILDAAQALGYRPNLSARGLRTERTNTIGVLVDDIMSPFVPPIVRGIQDHLVQHGFSCLIVNSDWNPDLEHSAIADLLSRPVDGIIFVEYSHASTSAELERSQKPRLFVHRLFGGAIKNSITLDEEQNVTLLMRHLLGLGHRRIAYINGPPSWSASQKRLAAYGAALAAHGIPPDPALMRAGDWEFQSGYDAAASLLAHDERPTAIFAANDQMALGAIYACQDAGVAVPGEIAVVGYDNRDFTRLMRPRITTVSLPAYEMGQAAAEQLQKQITEGLSEFDEIKIPGQLYIRESCGAHPAMRTPEEPLSKTGVRRLLLNRDPASE